MSELISKNELQRPLIITIGFDEIEMDNYLISPIDNKLDLINLDDVKKSIPSQFMESVARNLPFYIIRPEEMSILVEVMDIDTFYRDDIIILRNNLFDKTFTYKNTLSDISKAFEMLYLSEDSELQGNERVRIERINTFYGKVNFSKKSGNYFVTYSEDLWGKYKNYDYYEIRESSNPELVDEVVADITIPLDEEEILFLDFVSENNLNNSVNFIIDSFEQMPHRYTERIQVLKKLHPNLNITFSTPSIKRQSIDKLEDYRKILENVWGYSKFRELDMYSHIEKRDKNLLKISQAQIIDDIVQQVENARDGQSYRDIYITASTGAGKSVMFQVPTLYLTEKYKDDKPLILVISPLIGLMNDQVDSMKRKGVDNAETINGNTPPYEKQSILQRINDGKVDMLYLSPETLQARGDIKMLIGSRKIGMVIVDEAHIVTTWGKSFRADYWYLGIYLQKLRKEYQFPIITFTATAIYGGREDMYMDTRNSLNMIRPIAYFGLVRRNDIEMKIRSSNKFEEGREKDYRKTKNLLAFKHLEDAYRQKQKSLIYFPTIKLLNNFYSFLEENAKYIVDVSGKYYGSLTKEEKDTVLEGYKNGDIQFVMATKAFGMGIDIPDITNVYHFNPTGNVVDYVQEIGRVARNHKLVGKGYGILDYLPQDFNAVQQLQGMSKIKKNQIQGVMQKILDIYRNKGYNRNLVVSADDFKYIFSENIDDDSGSLDNKVKTILLMIEKDFSSSKKLGYSPFVARPRSIFGNELIIVSKDVESKLNNSSLKHYFEFLTSISGGDYSSVISVNLSGIWEKHYKTMSFPEFKYRLNTPEERDKMQHAKIFGLFNFASGVQYSFDNENGTRLSKYKEILESYQIFLDEMQRQNKQFEVKDLGKFIKNSLHISDGFEARSMAQVLINATFEFQKLKDIKVLREREATEKTLFSVVRSADTFAEFVSLVAGKLYNPKYNFVKDENAMNIFHYRNSQNLDEETIVLGIGEAFGLGNFTTLGGYNPQIYIRINSVYPVEQAIKQDQNYRNLILEDVVFKHRIGVAMQKYLFTHKENGMNAQEKITNYTKWFWDKIEDYFMGRLPSEVEESLFSKK
ncbi:DEAD/DEAH box helicase [Weissella diestrammenae]|nr:DEAD/DEAH box helicase [Weissella diestrammenae]